MPEFAVKKAALQRTVRIRNGKLTFIAYVLVILAAFRPYTVRWVSWLQKYFSKSSVHE